MWSLALLWTIVAYLFFHCSTSHAFKPLEQLLADLLHCTQKSMRSSPSISLFCEVSFCVPSLLYQLLMNYTSPSPNSESVPVGLSTTCPNSCSASVASVLSTTHLDVHNIGSTALRTVSWMADLCLLHNCLYMLSVSLNLGWRFPLLLQFTGSTGSMRLHIHNLRNWSPVIQFWREH